jgi:hypothetical protein
MGFWGWVVVVLIIVFVIGAMVQGWQEGSQQIANGQAHGISPSDMAKHGALREQMICPHCQTKGRVLTKLIQKKAGISGGKATGALLTGGVSLLATGLSRKEALTEAHCLNCSSTWHF